MKTFNTPYVELIKFNVADVITASNGDEEEDGGSSGGFIGENCFSN